MSNVDLYAPATKAEKEMAVLSVRVPRQLRDQFSELCKSRGIEVTTVIKRFLESEISKQAVPVTE